MWNWCTPGIQMQFQLLFGIFLKDREANSLERRKTSSKVNNYRIYPLTAESGIVTAAVLSAFSGALVVTTWLHHAIDLQKSEQNTRHYVAMTFIRVWSLFLLLINTRTYYVSWFRVSAYLPASRVFELESDQFKVKFSMYLVRRVVNYATRSAR